MNLAIRDFVAADRENYLSLSKEFYQSRAVDHGVPEAFFSRTFDACMAKSPYTKGFVFTVDDETAGYALISLTWSNEVGGICVLLEEAYILPPYQGKGIGSAFFAFVEKEYKNTARRFRLEVTPVNKEAINLYQRLGFSPLTYVQMTKDMV